MCRVRRAGGVANQDWAFYPHTNDSLAAVGVMFDDMAMENGPLMVIPGSHKGPIFDHHADGVFCGAMNPANRDVDFGNAVALTGKAGSITVHHVRAVHGSAPNISDRESGGWLLFQFRAADAWPILGFPGGIEKFEALMVAGQSRQPRLAPAPMRLSAAAGHPARLGLYENQKGMKTRFFGHGGSRTMSQPAFDGADSSTSIASSVWHGSGRSGGLRRLAGGTSAADGEFRRAALCRHDDGQRIGSGDGGPALSAAGNGRNALRPGCAPRCSVANHPGGGRCGVRGGPDRDRDGCGRRAGDGALGRCPGPGSLASRLWQHPAAVQASRPGSTRAADPAAIFPTPVRLGRAATAVDTAGSPLLRRCPGRWMRSLPARQGVYGVLVASPDRVLAERGIFRVRRSQTGRHPAGR